MNKVVYERWFPTAYEYRVKAEVVCDADIPKTSGKGSRATGKGAGASKGNGRKSAKDKT